MKLNCSNNKKFSLNFFVLEKQSESNLWWRNVNELKCNELKELASSLPHVIEAAFSNSTNKKYYRGWKNWLSWSSKKAKICPIPAEPFFVAIYLNFVLQNNNTRGALIDSFYGIRWGHHISGFSSPTSNPFVQVVFEGCKRLCMTDPRQKKDIITTEMMKQLIEAYSGAEESLPNLRFLVMSVFCFTGFMRIEEILKTKLKNIKVMGKHLEIFLEKSKTDQLREGNIIYISRLESNYCPVKLFEKYLHVAKFDLGKDKEAFLICRLQKMKKGHIASKLLGISYSRAREIFNEYVKPFNSERKNYGLHSLRSGGASAAAQNGISDRLISKHGRWSSERGRDGYIKDSTKDRNKVSKSLGL